MNLESAERLAKRLIKNHLPEFRFKWTNAKRTFGYCWWFRKVIGLSKPLTELNPKHEVLDTILHEIAHGLAHKRHGEKEKGHGKLWKAICVEIGARPERCYTRSVKQPAATYIVVCLNCGKFWGSNKKKNVCELPQWACKKCGKDKSLGKLRYGRASEKSKWMKTFWMTDLPRMTEFRISEKVVGGILNFFLHGDGRSGQKLLTDFYMHPEFPIKGSLTFIRLDADEVHKDYMKTRFKVRRKKDNWVVFTSEVHE